jgi:DNA-binding transcriptional ArsR family regulator
MSTDLVTFGKAISDETRQRIMALLCCRELCVSDLVDELQDLSQPTVSHHLQILKAAGLVDTRRDGKQIYYTLRQEAVVGGCCGIAERFAPGIDVTVTDAQASQA